VSTGRRSPRWVTMGDGAAFSTLDDVPAQSELARNENGDGAKASLISNRSTVVADSKPARSGLLYGRERGRGPNMPR